MSASLKAGIAGTHALNSQRSHHSRELTPSHVAGLPARRSRPESLPIVANGVFATRDMDNIAPLSSPKAINHEPNWAQAEPATEVSTKKPRRGLFGRKTPAGECTQM